MDHIPKYLLTSNNQIPVPPQLSNPFLPSLDLRGGAHASGRRAQQSWRRDSARIIRILPCARASEFSSACRRASRTRRASTSENSRAREKDAPSEPAWETFRGRARIIGCVPCVYIVAIYFIPFFFFLCSTGTQVDTEKLAKKTLRISSGLDGMCTRARGVIGLGRALLKLSV